MLVSQIAVTVPCLALESSLSAFVWSDRSWAGSCCGHHVPSWERGYHGFRQYMHACVALGHSTPLVFFPDHMWGTGCGAQPFAVEVTLAGCGC
jgi:hypothetical protein